MSIPKSRDCKPYMYYDNSNFSQLRITTKNDNVNPNKSLCGMMYSSMVSVVEVVKLSWYVVKLSHTTVTIVAIIV